MSIKEWKTLESSYVVKNKFLSLKKNKCITDKEIQIDEYFILEYPTWVNAIAITSNKEIVLVKQYRYAVNKISLEIPAGAVEENEQPEEAIKRELLEETGFCSKEEPILLGEYYTNASNATNKIKTYLFVDVEKIAAIENPEGEETEVVLYPWNEIDKLLQSGEINQVFSTLGIMLAKKHEGES